MNRLMKGWRLGTHDGVPRLLLHYCVSRHGGYAGYVASTDENGWYCTICKVRAPVEIEDVALLARCMAWNDPRFP